MEADKIVNILENEERLANCWRKIVRFKRKMRSDVVRLITGPTYIFKGGANRKPVLFLMDADVSLIRVLRLVYCRWIKREKLDHWSQHPSRAFLNMATIIGKAATGVAARRVESFSLFSTLNREFERQHHLYAWSTRRLIPRFYFVSCSSSLRSVSSNMARWNQPDVSFKLPLNDLHSVWEGGSVIFKSRFYTLRSACSLKIMAVYSTITLAYI